ncbi:MAG TPA: hypothetical protein VF469_40815 [Kofleriaceae bacterium]
MTAMLESMVTTLGELLEAQIYSSVRQHPIIARRRRQELRGGGAVTLDAEAERALQLCRRTRQVLRESQQRYMQHGFEMLATRTEQALARIASYLPE